MGKCAEGGCGEGSCEGTEGGDDLTEMQKVSRIRWHCCGTGSAEVKQKCLFFLRRQSGNSSR